MKLLIGLILCMVIFSSCRKDKIATQDSSSICFEPTYLDTEIQEGLTAIFFLNGRDGFVATYNGGIYKTEDAAKTWTRLNSTTTLPIRDIYFLDAKNGIAVGGMNSCDGTGCTPPGGFILRTTDGGQTWNRVFTPTRKTEITSIDFINEKMGFCVGDHVIYKTTDGGQSWTENPIPVSGGEMMKIRFGNDKVGLIVGIGDKMLRTVDGGNTWKIMTLGTNTGYYSLSWSGETVYISGQGNILRSKDGGITWDKLARSPTDIFDIYFTSENIGYAFGRGNYSGGDFGLFYGAMYCTGNGGKTWNGNGNFKEVGLIQSVSFPSDQIGYAISQNKVIKIVIE